MVFDTGITGVVGPNGSGKSNISDAVRWVLGEQSAKTLRGAKMEDVIFGGTEKRKPLSYCEVSLTSWTTRTARCRCSTAEVMITRRVYRSGESEYYLNKGALPPEGHRRPFPRHRHRQGGLFADRPGQDRRDPLRAQRGPPCTSSRKPPVSAKYKARKAEAERRMENTNQNLTRVEDILAEAGRQAGPLEPRPQTRALQKLMDELRRAGHTRVPTCLRRGPAAHRAADGRSPTEAQMQAAQGSPIWSAAPPQETRVTGSRRRPTRRRRPVRRTRVVEATRAAGGSQGAVQRPARAHRRRNRERERLAGERTGASRQAHAEMPAAVKSSRRGEVDATLRRCRQAVRDQEEAECQRPAERLREEAERIEARKEEMMQAINRLSDVKSARRA